MTSAKRPLWKCPQCGHRFVTKNLSHSCVRIPLAVHFTGRPPERRKTYDRWLAAARACGRMTAYAQKSRIIFMARVRFGGVTVHSSYVDARLWLKRPVQHRLLRRSDNYGRMGYDHHFRLERADDVDDALRALMREAYQVGLQQARGMEHAEKGKAKGDQAKGDKAKGESTEDEHAERARKKGVRRRVEQRARPAQGR